MQNQWGLVAKDGEHPNTFLVRVIQAQALQEAIDLLEQKLPFIITGDRMDIQSILNVLRTLIQKGN